jgi:hypothetical protein
MGYQGLFHCFNKNSRALLCMVSLQCERDTFFALKFRESRAIALLPLRPSTSVICPQPFQRYVDLFLSSTFEHNS